MDASGLIIGVDATNLRIGGGITHLIELMSHANPDRYNIKQIIVWGCIESLDRLPTKNWLKKINIGSVHGGHIRRNLWQRFCLSKAAKQAGCDLLFVPGGNYIGRFSPVVTMSRNMLPFQWKELFRYGTSFMTFRLMILRQLQAFSFRHAQGLIFLTDHARITVGKTVGKISGKSTVIPHGLSARFSTPPKEQHPIETYSTSKPFRLLYVSIIDVYKHQWALVDAVDLLRQEGFPIELDLIGPAYRPSLRKLQFHIQKSTDNGSWAHYRGNIPYAELAHQYAQADLGIFASSCENMPNILLETMAAGLPVASSNLGPMPEVLCDAGLYFDPENTLDIATVIRQYLLSPQLRAEKSHASFLLSQRYSWSKCADQTLSFLADVAVSHGRNPCAA